MQSATMKPTISPKIVSLRFVQFYEAQFSEIAIRSLFIRHSYFHSNFAKECEKLAFHLKVVQYDIFIDVAQLAALEGVRLSICGHTYLYKFSLNISFDVFTTVCIISNNPTTALETLREKH